MFRLAARAFGLYHRDQEPHKVRLSLLVRRVLETPELEVETDAMSVGVSFRCHLVQLVLINNNGSFHSVTC